MNRLENPLMFKNTREQLELDKKERKKKAIIDQLNWN